MTWSRKKYEEMLKGMERSPYDENYDHLNVRAVYEYAKKHNIEPNAIPENIRETFVTRRKISLK